MQSRATQFEIANDAESSPSTPFDRLPWPLFLLLAWIVFELTANASLSLVLACLKFGANDFRTAWWLWRVDPHRPRARACATFYAASAVWKTTIVPLLTAASIGILWGMLSPQAMRVGHPITRQLVLALNVSIWAGLLLVVLVSLSIVLARLARWRVWVHPNLHLSRREKNWPPQFAPTTVRQANQGILVVLTALFAVVLLGPVITLILLNALNLPAPVQRTLELAVVFGFPIFGVLSLGLLRGKLFASSPWECWPESIQALEAV